MPSDLEICRPAEAVDSVSDSSPCIAPDARVRPHPDLWRGPGKTATGQMRQIRAQSPTRDAFHPFAVERLGPGA